jgi:hypothetical protein
MEVIMDMRLKTFAFAFAFATLLVVPLHGMSQDDNEINSGGEIIPHIDRSQSAPPRVTTPVQHGPVFVSPQSPQTELSDLKLSDEPAELHLEHSTASGSVSNLGLMSSGDSEAQRSNDGTSTGMDETSKESTAVFSPEPTAGIQVPFSSPQVLSMGTASAQVSFVKQSAQSGSMVGSNTDKQFVKQSAQGMQQDPDLLSDLHDSSPEFDGDVKTSYSSVSQAPQSHGALSTHLSASASHLASHSGNSFSPPVSPIPLAQTESDVQPVVTVIEQPETKTEQRDVVPLAPTYGTSDDAISRLLQENYQRIATYNPYHAWLLAQVTDFCVEGRPVIQVYLDARYDEQKDAIIQTIESMNPGLNRRYPETTEADVVDREGKDAIDDTTGGGTTTTSTGSLVITQPAAAIITQSSDMQGSVPASDWTSYVIVHSAAGQDTSILPMATSTGASSATHSMASVGISDDDDNDESGVSRTCVITSRPGADTH